MPLYHNIPLSRCKYIYVTAGLYNVVQDTCLQASQHSFPIPMFPPRAEVNMHPHLAHQQWQVPDAPVFIGFHTVRCSMLAVYCNPGAVTSSRSGGHAQLQLASVSTNCHYCEMVVSTRPTEVHGIDCCAGQTCLDAVVSHFSENVVSSP